MKTESDETRQAKNFSLFLVSILEDYAIQNAKLKAFVLRLPEAREPEFSLASLLAETEQAADTVRDLRQRYDQVRGMLLESPPREAKAREAIQRGEGTNQTN